MGHFENVWVWLFGLVATFSSFLSGYTEGGIKILMAVMALDIVSGILKGAKQKRLWSAIMALGIYKKAGIFLAIIFAIVIDLFLNNGVPVFTTLMIYVSVAYESLSVMENFQALGVHIPDKLKDRLVKVAEDAESIQLVKDRVDTSSFNLLKDDKKKEEE